MTLRDRIQDGVDWLKRVVTQPRGELTRWQAAVRFAYDLGRYGARQLREDRAGEMAAALAFRTLFALFPVMVVAGAMFQGLYGREPFREFVRNLIKGLGLADVPVPPVENGEAVVDAEAEAVELGAWLEEFIFQVSAIDLAALGWVGLLVVIYASITMMATIEESFNIIVRAPEGRAWTWRFPIYWTVLTVGALVIWLIFLIDGRLGEWLAEVGFADWLGELIRTIWTFAIIMLTLFGIYVLVPNTRVAKRSAMIGAFVSGIGVFIGKELLAGYVATFVTIRQLYGAIGFVPLLMFWVYVMWMVILFGLEVAATLQSLGGRRNMEEMESKRPRSGMIDPASILLVMEHIAERFGEGRSASARQISEATSIPSQTVGDMLERLTAAGLVHRLDEDEACVTLAKPPEQITADQMIEVGYSMVDELSPHRKTELIRRLREAERDLAAGSTLASLLSRPDGAAAPPDQPQVKAESNERR